MVVGNTDRAEFTAARASLDRWGKVVDVATAYEATLRMEREHVVPDVVVIAQYYPGQFTADHIEQIRRRAPLARFLGLLGSWCEGEVRTGQPWPAVIRIYWHQWQARCDHEMSALSKGLTATWTLPVTATEEERLLAQCRRPKPTKPGLILIHSNSYEMYDWLSDACRRKGNSSVWLRPNETVCLEGVTSGIFDGTDFDATEVQQFRNLRSLMPEVPIITMLDFPRIEDHQRATNAGSMVVLSKPLLIEDLYWQLDKLLEEGTEVDQLFSG